MKDLKQCWTAMTSPEHGRMGFALPLTQLVVASLMSALACRQATWREKSAVLQVQTTNFFIYRLRLALVAVFGTLFCYPLMICHIRGKVREQLDLDSGLIEGNTELLSTVKQFVCRYLVQLVPPRLCIRTSFQ